VELTKPSSSKSPSQRFPKPSSWCRAGPVRERQAVVLGIADAVEILIRQLGGVELRGAAGIGGPVDQAVAVVVLLVRALRPGQIDQLLAVDREIDGVGPVADGLRGLAEEGGRVGLAGKRAIREQHARELPVAAVLDEGRPAESPLLAPRASCRPARPW
jgi:hypothetical protein